MIDLKQFCWKGEDRDYFVNPFTRGEFTYATNGVVLVRVPKRDEYGDSPEAPDVGNPFSLFPFGPTHEVMRHTLPDVIERECVDCCGTGHAHTCPKCDCPCRTCDGTKIVIEDYDISIDVLGVPIAATPFRQLLALPNLRIGRSPKEGDPICFSFTGGDGLLMPLRCGLVHHYMATMVEVGNT